MGFGEDSTETSGDFPNIAVDIRRVKAPLFWVKLKQTHLVALESYCFETYELINLYTSNIRSLNFCYPNKTVSS